MSKTKSIIVWVVQILLVIPFLMTGIPKLVSASGWVTRFRAYGYPEHFYLVIGAIEVLGAIGLLIPRVAAPAAISLITVMIGAACTHLLHSEGRRVLVNLFLMLLLIVVAYARWRKFMVRTKRPALSV
jgi:putative oxidoreductase